MPNGTRIKKILAAANVLAALLILVGLLKGALAVATREVIGQNLFHVFHIK